VGVATEGPQRLRFCASSDELGVRIGSRILADLTCSVFDLERGHQFRVLSEVRLVAGHEIGQ